VNIQFVTMADLMIDERLEPYIYDNMPMIGKGMICSQVTPF
jgi:hypothetical protein